MCKRSLSVLLALVLLAGCDFSVVTGGASGTGTGSGSGSGSGSGGGTGTGGGSNPTPTPLPSPSPGNRTPDPTSGGVLPFPGYAAGAVDVVATQLTVSSCQSGTYLDAVIFALRAYDTRWGYQCKDAACSTLSNDRIAYHATAGPDIRGASGVWTVDIIGAACTAPVPAWQPDGFNATLWFTPTR